jgi:hypothetical protein
MPSWFSSSKKESGETDGSCLRSTFRSDFSHYRQFYGLVPPNHEQGIHLGDLAYFSRAGEYTKLAGMFDRPDTPGSGVVSGRWVSVERSEEGSVFMAEELVFDPFVNRATQWKSVHEERLERYMSPVLCLVW